MDYREKMKVCEKHGPTQHYLAYEGWQCEKCLFKYFQENQNENVRIMSELNINEVGF